MKELFTSLSDEEYERLDRFLLERIDEDAETLDKDEGVLDISELDGLFTAIVSGPVTTAPSRRLPVVWGEDEWCEGYWRGHEFELEELEKIQQAIAPNVRKIQAYWLAPAPRPSLASNSRTSLSYRTGGWSLRGMSWIFV